MSAAGKRRALLGGLLAVTLWPLVQMSLVARYDLSPWKLAGWGMYAAPRLGAVVDVLVRRPGEPDGAPLGMVSRRVIVEADRFLQRWHWLRRLERPDTFARFVLEEFPEYEHVEIVVRQLTIDRGSGMIVAEPHRFEYGR